MYTMLFEYHRSVRILIDRESQGGFHKSLGIVFFHCCCINWQICSFAIFNCILKIVSILNDVLEWQRDEMLYICKTKNKKKNMLSWGDFIVSKRMRLKLLITQLPPRWIFEILHYYKASWNFLLFKGYFNNIYNQNKVL